MPLPFVYLGPYPGSDTEEVYLSGPADTAEKRKLFVYFGDDYAADIPIQLPGGVNHETCTAVLALSKEDEPNIRFQRNTIIFDVDEIVYVRFVLDKEDYTTLKPGRYKYDIEVRTAEGDHGTKVSSYVTIYRTFVQ